MRHGSTGVMAIDDPKTWRPYNKKMCDSCSANCCTLLVEINSEDLIRLGFASLWEVQHSLKQLVKGLKKDQIIKRYNSKTGKFVLTQNADGTCVFLDRNCRCSVYDRRPQVCREHPAISGPRTGYCAYSPKQVDSIAQSNYC